MKCLIGCNVLTEVDAQAYISHCQLWYRAGRDFPNWKFIFYAPHRTSIDNMRNLAAQLALEQECDYLMFIDDDMVLHPNTLKSLVEADKDIVMAHTFIRGYPFPPMAFKDPNPDPTALIKALPKFEEYKEHIDENGLFEVDAVGFATVLIKCELLKKVDPPYFLTLPNMTEDIYFCHRVKNLFGRDKVSIFVDTKVPTGHLLEKEVISEDTKEMLCRRHKVEEERPLGDRGDEYLKEMECALT